MVAISPIFISSLTTTPDFKAINCAKSATLISSGIATSITFLSTGFLKTCLLSTLSAEGRPDFSLGLEDLSPITSSSSTRGFFLLLLIDGFLAAFLAILSSSSSSTGLAECLRPLSWAGSTGAGSGFGGVAAVFLPVFFSSVTASFSGFLDSSVAFSSNLIFSAASSACLASVAAVRRFLIADWRFSSISSMPVPNSTSLTACSRRANSSASALACDSSSSSLRLT